MLLHANAIYYKNICIYNYYLRQGSIIRSEYTLKKFHDILFIAEDLLKLSSKKLRRKTKKNIGYLAIVGTSVSIGRILKDNSLTVSDRKALIEFSDGIPAIIFISIYICGFIKLFLFGFKKF